MLVRIKGQAPLAATVYELEKLRCNLCGNVYTAEAPPEAGEKKYDETAVSMMAVLRYGSGVPWNRTEGLEANLGIPLPAATQCEILSANAVPLQPALEELKRQAAQSEVVHNDDTSMRVLSLDRDTDISPERTGVFTSGLVWIVQKRRIALYFTGCKHAGENLAEVLKLRSPDLPPIIQMCDALSRNVPKIVETLVANCNAHGRRNFVKVTANFPEPCRFVLETFREIYGYDAVAREQGMSAEERLAFHQEHSKPVMDKLHAWLEAQFDERLVEPNSGLGQAISYLLNHWQKLTLFLEKAGRTPGQQHRGKGPEEGHSASQELAVLQDPEGSADGRPVHEPDPHLRTQRRQCIRLPHGVAAARRGVEAEPVGVDAVELPRDAGAAGDARGRVI